MFSFFILPLSVILDLQSLLSYERNCQCIRKELLVTSQLKRLSLRLCVCFLQEDFECDFGYERYGNSSCQRMTGISSNDCEQISNGNYYVSESHLRLIHNDSCVGVERVVTDSDGHGTCVGSHCSNNGKGRGALGKFFIFLLVSCLTWQAHVCPMGRR